MDLKAFLSTLPDEPARERFAAECGTTLGHLRNCIYSQKSDKPKHPSVPTCVLLERNSGGEMTRRELRPDWAACWPELIGTDGAPTPTPETEKAA